MEDGGAQMHTLEAVLASLMVLGSVTFVMCDLTTPMLESFDSRNVQLKQYGLDVFNVIGNIEPDEPMIYNQRQMYSWTMWRWDGSQWDRLGHSTTDPSETLTFAVTEKGKDPGPNGPTGPDDDRLGGKKIFLSISDGFLTSAAATTGSEPIAVANFTLYGTVNETYWFQAATSNPASQGIGTDLSQIIKVTVNSGDEKVLSPMDYSLTVSHGSVTKNTTSDPLRISPGDHVTFYVSENTAPFNDVKDAEIYADNGQQVEEPGNDDTDANGIFVFQFKNAGKYILHAEDKNGNPPYSNEVAIEVIYRTTQLAGYVGTGEWDKLYDLIDDYIPFNVGLDLYVVDANGQYLTNTDGDPSVILYGGGGLSPDAVVVSKLVYAKDPLDNSAYPKYNVYEVRLVLWYL